MHLQDPRTAYLGPGITGLFLEAIETGIIINQSITFWERADDESWAVRAIVAFVLIIAILQTGLVFYAVWYTHVIHFGDWAIVFSFTWADKIQSVVTVSMATPVQAFLIWRCWALTHRRWIILVPFTIILLLSTISSILVTVETFHVNFAAYAKTSVQVSNALPHIQPSPTFILSLTCSAVLDIAVTGILLTYLSQSKTSVVSSRLRRILRRLTILIWEAAVPPCVCAILTVVTYLTLVDVNDWDLTFQAVLGKLYVISLFVTLNGRADLKHLTTKLGASSQLTDVVWIPRDEEIALSSNTMMLAAITDSANSITSTDASPISEVMHEYKNNY